MILWRRRTPKDVDRATAEEAIKAEVAGIEGRVKLPVPASIPTASPPPVLGDPVPREPGALARAILQGMDGPAPAAPPGPVRAADGATPNHRPPGRGGAGMVDNAAAAPLFALCLSGGGIRSAAFCLGAVQSLAKDGLLARFHYLSTVSGGGYTGSLIARLIHTMGGVAPAERALADPQCAPDVGWLVALRDDTSFLAPHLSATALDVWAAVVLYVRNTLANWVLFLPGLIALALLPRLYLRLMDMAVHGAGADWAWIVAGLAAVSRFVAAIGACRLIPGHQAARDRPGVTAAVVIPQITAPLFLGWAFLATLWIAARGSDGTVYVVPVIAAAMSLAAYVVAWVAEDWPLFLANAPGWIVATAADSLVLLAGIRLAQHVAPYDPILLAVLGPAWIVLAHLLHAACHAVLRRETAASWMAREWIARLSATEVLSALLWTALAATCLVLLHRLHWLLGDQNSTLVLPAILTGPIAAWLGRSSLTVAETALSKVTRMQVFSTLLAALVSMVFLVTLLMLASAAGWRIAAELGPLSRLTCCARGLEWTSPDGAPGFWALLLVAVVLGAASLTIGRLLNVNHYSLHELYRNRLVRAFLGSARRNGRRMGDGFTNFDQADALRLSDALPFHPTAAHPSGLRLFPVVNTTLNLVSGTRTAWAERKAASFTMTPLHCGSAVLNKDGVYVGSAVYGGTPYAYPRHALNPGMQLGTAMTISGAAVSPDQGYQSSATTSFIMTLFNARLGAWLPNPATASSDAMQRSRPPNGFIALVSEMLGLANDTSQAIYLSDGGHFENLGIYEMLRRRCRLIVAFDAGCDPGYAYFDLGSALRKARIDLGVEVTFPPGAGPTPGQAPAGVLRADIVYPPGAGMPASSGVLLYVKSHLPPSAPADVLAFQAADTAFPHDTTSNQFFTESQFESYRRLGEYLAA